MQLTPHFTLAEITASATARARNIDNSPPKEVFDRLVSLAEMLERIRSTVGAPIIVTSGYRSTALNEAVGGVINSDHSTGQAADIVVPKYGTPTEVAQLLAPLVDVLKIGQLILEGVKGKTWVHVSTKPSSKLINRVITITDAGARVGIHGVNT